MARPLRIEYPEAWYHITCRGNEQRTTFKDDKDRRQFIAKLIASLRDYSVQLHCYVLMPNHFHLIIKTLAANLSRFMQRFNTAYSIYFNLRHDRKGHLYQGRFKGILVEADEYLINLSRYIHLNPVRVKRYRDLPLDEKLKVLTGYRWSSYRAYAGFSKQAPYINYNQILYYTGGNTRTGKKQYRDFVVAGLTGELQNPLEDARSGLVLGSEKFCEWIGEHFLTSLESKGSDLQHFGEILHPILVESIAHAVAAEYRVEAGSILRKNSPLKEARRVLIELSYRLNITGKSLRDLGNELGGISGSHVAKIHREVILQAGNNATLAKSITRLTQLLLGSKIRPDPD